MKAIIASDIHAHKYRSFNQDGRRLGNIVKLIEQLFELVHSNKAMLWISGDLFNTMQTIQTEALVAVTTVFTRMTTQYPDVIVLIISGNHDYATYNSIETPAVSAIQALVQLSDNIHLLDNDSWGGNNFVVHGVPYYDDPGDLKLALEDLKKKMEDDRFPKGFRNFLLMHQSVGFGHDLVPDDIDPNDTLLSRFGTVFNGHIHNHSVQAPHFINVGSPIHRDAADIGKEKGVLLFDTETNQFERIILDFPQYRRITEGDTIPKEWKDDYIQIEPKQIEVDIEEKEIKEKFDHVKTTKSDMLLNYISIKVDEKAANAGAIRTYGEKLLSHAD